MNPTPTPPGDVQRLCEEFLNRMKEGDSHDHHWHWVPKQGNAPDLTGSQMARHIVEREAYIRTLENEHRAMREAMYSSGITAGLILGDLHPDQQKPNAREYRDTIRRIYEAQKAILSSLTLKP